MDKGVWWATVHKVTQSSTWLKRLSTHACTHTRTHTHTYTHIHSCIHMLFQNLFHCRLLQGIEYSPVLYSKSMLLHNSWGWVPEAQKLHCPSVWLDVSIRLHDLFHSQGVKTLPYSVQNKGLICKYVSEKCKKKWIHSDWEAACQVRD